MIRGHAHKRRRTAIIKAALVLVAGIVLFTPKMESLRIPDVGSFGLPPFITDAQAGES